MTVSNRLVRSTPVVAVFRSLILLSLVLPACSDEEPTDTQDAVPEIDRDETSTKPQWSTTVLEEDGFGLHARLAVGPNDELGVAYFGVRATATEACDELGVPEPPTKQEWELRYAYFDGSRWNSETVFSNPYVGEPPGLDFQFAPDGTPSIAVMHGPPVAPILFCGASDVVLFQRDAGGQWSSSTAVTTSGQAATGEPGSDYGDVVGHWPGLAFAPNGDIGIMYKDVHSGGMQSDDFRRADLEYARRRGGWSALPVLWGIGAGNYNRLLYDAESHPYVVFYNPSEDVSSRVGIWIARQMDESADWETVQLFNNRTPSGPSAVFVDDAMYVAYYEANLGYPQLAHCPDLTQFSDVSAWEQSDIGDSRYDEGYSPSLASAASGRLGVAYYRCGRQSGGLGDCAFAEDALVFAYRDGSAWTREVVDEGDMGLCGMSPSLGFDSSTTAWVAYRCESFDEETQLLKTQLRVARREKL